MASAALSFHDTRHSVSIPLRQGGNEPLNLDRFSYPQGITLEHEPVFDPPALSGIKQISDESRYLFS